MGIESLGAASPPPGASPDHSALPPRSACSAEAGLHVERGAEAGLHVERGGVLGALLRATTRRRRSEASSAATRATSRFIGRYTLEERPELCVVSPASQFGLLWIGSPRVPAGRAAGSGRGRVRDRHAGRQRAGQTMSSKAAGPAEGSTLEFHEHWQRVYDAKDAAALEAALRRVPQHVDKVALVNAGDKTTYGKGTTGLTALHRCVINGNVACARVLLAAGADPNKGNSYGSTALHWATMDNRIDAVRLLLGAGANPFAARNDGKTPKGLAEEWRHLEILSAMESVSDDGVRGIIMYSDEVI